MELHDPIRRGLGQDPNGGTLTTIREHNLPSNEVSCRKSAPINGGGEEAIWVAIEEHSLHEFCSKCLFNVNHKFFGTLCNDKWVHSGCHVGAGRTLCI